MMRNKLLSATTALCLMSSAASAGSLSNVFADNLFSGATDVVGDLMDTLMPGVTNFRLGLGPAVSPEYEGAKHYNVYAAPLISLRYKNLVEVDNNQVRVNLFGEKGAIWESSNFRAGPTLKIDFDRSEKDSLDLKGLGNVGTSFELGAFASYTNGPMRYRVRVRQDVASGHKGMLSDLDVSLAVFRTKTVTVGSRLGTTWVSKKYMTSYFGVNATQARASGLPVYTAGAGIKDVSLSVGGEMKVAERWAVVVNGGYQRLLSKAKSSPLVRLRGSPNTS
ncbi:MAG: MipA/OmpV family protein [Rhodospirillaceae bacterium]|nr:MipA/OmpV family protein [Rhodospirillaceae bacterium]